MSSEQETYIERLEKVLKGLKEGCYSDGSDDGGVDSGLLEDDLEEVTFA